MERENIKPQKSLDNNQDENNTSLAPDPDAEVIKILDELPKQKKDTLIRALSYRKTYSGPLPAPEDFMKYKDVLSDAPERILKMAEKQTDHRIESEQKIIRIKGRESLIGQLAGLLISICCLIVACILGLNGHDWLAGVIPTSVAGLAAIFVLHKKKKSNKEEDS